MSTVVIDCTTGERAGRESLEAAAAISLESSDLFLILVGDETEITQALERTAHDAERLRVVHAPDRLDRSVPARTALSRAPESPVRVGLEIVAERADAAFVSAGHAGPVVLEAARRLTLLPNVRRAALAAVYPTLRHRGARNDPFALFLDVGATITCETGDLVAFAVMGAAYARKISVNPRPRVALLSNSEQPDVAPSAIEGAHRQLVALESDFEYVGCIRADQITRGDADVIVSDGFTGDVVIRTLEGVVSTAQALLARADERFSWRLGVQMLGSGIERLKELVDWENYGGAPLLGYDRSLIITQTNSHRRAFVNAIRLAAKIERTGVVDEVATAVEALGELEADDG